MTLEDLNLHLDMVNQLKSARESLEYLEARLLGAQQFDGMPHGSGTSRKVENFSLVLKEQSEDVIRLERVVQKSEKSIRKWIDTIPDNRTKLIFKLRFVCGMKWDDVAQSIGADNSSDSVRSICRYYLNKTNSAE